MLESIKMCMAYHVSLFALADNDSWFYNGLVVNESSTDTVGFTKFTKLNVASKFVNFIFDIGINACGSQTAYKGQNMRRQCTPRCVSYGVERNMKIR